MEYFIHYSLILISIFGKRLKDFQKLFTRFRKKHKERKKSQPRKIGKVWSLTYQSSTSLIRWHLFFSSGYRLILGNMSCLYSLLPHHPSPPPVHLFSPGKIKMIILWMRTDFAPLTVMECWFFVSSSLARGREPCKLSFLYACWLQEHGIKFMILYGLGDSSGRSSNFKGKEEFWGIELICFQENLLTVLSFKEKFIFPVEEERQRAGSFVCNVFFLLQTTSSIFFHWT